MKIKLHHIAFVYEDLAEPIKFFKDFFDEEAEEFVLEERGLKGAFINLPNTSIEILSPTRDKTAISNFLKRRGGGIHHICLAVDDFDTFIEEVKKRGIAIVDGPRPGVHGERVAFLDPRSTQRVLIEVTEEAPSQQKTNL